MREVLTSPDTSPASPGAAPDVASEASGVVARPAPSIMRIPGHMIAVTKRPSAVIVDCQANPVTATVAPSTATHRAPSGRMRRGASFEPTTIASELGIRDAPAARGE